jgi:hypothetical protein
MTEGATETFRTHANYLRALSLLAGYPSAGLGGRRALEAAAGRIRRNLVRIGGRPLDIGQVLASLENAWGTELLMNLTAKYAQEDELVSLSNNWSAVQAYYAIYHATQALLVAQGSARPDSHAKTQSMFADLWTVRPASVAPWSLGVAAAGERNGPSGRSIDFKIHSWVACSTVSCWDIAAKAIATTRSEALKSALQRGREERRRAARREWQLEEQLRAQHPKRARKEPKFGLPRLTEADAAKINERLRPYSMFDYLYRLRIKTNYEDASMFIEGPEHPAQSRQVRRDLLYLTSATLLLNELHISILVGEARLTGWMDGWLKENQPGGLELGLALRRPLL